MRIICGVLILLLFGCGKEKQLNDHKQLIIGDWEKIPGPLEIDPVYGELPLFHIPQGYSFLKNGMCEVKHRISGYNEKEKLCHYYGTYTNYNLVIDSLRLYNPINNKWFAIKIDKLAGDTLVLDNIKFVKKKFNISQVLGFDAVVVSASPCYGSCPINDIIIENNGNVIYQGRNFNAANGNFESAITQEQFKRIGLRFRKANYLDLKNDYSAEVTDNSTVSISFIKDGRIVKSISDYAGSAPQDLIWAYEPLIYISQQLKLTPKVVPEHLKSGIFTSFETAKTTLRLTQAEAFYLFNELQRGKHVAIAFDEEYTLSHYEAVNKITTDGRFYKFYFVDKTTKTIDLGYNFLTNNLVNKFEDKHEQNYTTI